MNMNRYFAIKQMWEDRHDQVVADLRTVWERYRDLKCIKPYGEMFPDSVKDIYRGTDGHYHIRGSIYCRGCTDNAECKLPYALVDSEDREEWFQNLAETLQRDREAENARNQAKQEEQERALLATLQAKYKEEK